MTDFPDLKLKALVSFPAVINGGSGISVEKEAGSYTFALDYAELVPITSPNQANSFVSIWDALSDTYRSISIAGLSSAIGGNFLTDAASDGSAYGRRNAAWTPVLPIAGGTMSGAVALAPNSTAPTPAANDNSSKIAPTAYVDVAVSGKVAKTGDTMTGPLINPSKSNQLGATGGAAATTAVTQADANILLYTAGATNWAGIGIDTAGSMWFRTGISGTPAPAMYIDGTVRTVNFNLSPLAPTPTAGDSSTQLATTAFVTPVAIGKVAKAGDTMTGPLINPSKSNQFGAASGTAATGAVTPADANILLYNASTTNWAGIGTDTGGSMWFKTGVSGTPAPAMRIDGTSLNTFFTGTVRAGSGTTGSYYFGNSGSLQYDGTNFSFSTGAVTVNGTLQLNSGTPQVNFLLSGTLQSYINDNGSSINVWSNAAGNAGMYIIHSGNSWAALSDARLPYKKTARPLSVLDKLDKVQLYENEVHGHLEMFVKAQELNEAFPHLVISGSDTADLDPKEMSNPGVLWGVTYDRAGVAALQGLKEVKELIAELRARVAALEAFDARL